MNKICPLCIQSISNFANAIGRTTVVNGIEYHKACLKDTTIKELEGDKWVPVKSP